MKNQGSLISIKHGLLLLIFLILVPLSHLTSQTSLYFSMDGAYAGLSGQLYSIGANETLAHGSFGLGFTYSNFGERLRRGIEYDTAISSEEYGLSGYYTQFFQKERSSGLYWGLRPGIYFSKTRISSFGRRSESSEFLISLTGQFGYQIQVDESTSFKIQLSSGYVDRSWANLFGLQISTVLKKPKDS